MTNGDLATELAQCKAQLEAAAISAEQSSQAMEQRYSALAEAHSKLAAEKERLGKENEELRKDVTTARGELHSLQSQLMQRDAEGERRRMEAESAQRERVALENLLQEKQSDIDEFQTRLQAAADKIIALTKTNTELDAQLHAAQAAQSRAALQQARFEQEKEILEKGNKWLNEELERKSQAFSEERSQATKRILELQARLAEVEGTSQRLRADHTRLTERFEQHRKAAEEAASALREAREGAASKEEAFEKELAMAHRMAQLYRESADERTRRCTALEGVVAELQSHMEAAAAAHQEALEKAEEARKAADARAEEEKALRERVVAAAASAALPGGTPPPAAASTPQQGAAFADTGGSPAIPSPSATELYSKYMEMHQRWQQERSKNRQREIVMEELLIEVERRAALVKEQQQEYESIKASYSRVSASLEELAAEKRRLENALAEASATARRNERDRRSLEQQVKDLGQQVSRMLYESQRAASGAPRGGEASPQFGGGNASDVTTQLLVEFKDIDELQQQNQRLLRVNRELSEAAEATRAEAEEELRRDYEAQLEKVASELDDLRRGREAAEEVLSQVVRQRDTLRQLLQGTDGDLSDARALYARSVGASDGRQKQQQATTTGPADAGNGSGPSYRDLYAELEVQFKDFRQEATKNQSMLSQDLARAKEDAATAKSEASRSAAAAEFERDRAARLVSTLETQRQQMEGLMASNAKYQALITETERRLHAAQTQADEARDVLRRESMRAEGLQAEKGLLVAAERRLTEEAAGLSKEKYRLAAELEAARTLHAEREETLRAEALRAREEAARAIRELSDAQRELVSARYRSDAATRAAEHAEVQFGQRIGQLEEEARRAQDALSSAQQRASAAEAKVDLLQEAVRKAEERAARLEMERSARVPPEIPPAAAGLTGTTTQSSASIEGELRAEIKLLREELASAQEAAAAATGHAKQFELLARTAEEALKSVQADHEKFKREAVARVAAADEDATSLRASLAEKEAALREAKQAEQEFAAECERLDEERAAERSALQAAVEQAHADREQDKEQVARLSQDMETLRRQLEDAKRAYDAEVMAHGDALRRLSAADSALAAAQQRLAAVSQDLDNERAARQATESELRGRLSEVEGKLTESQRQAQSLVEQRNLLQEQLEKAAEGAAGDGGGDFANALRLLRREREAAEINLQLAERELVRLRQEAVVARRAAEEARAQLAAEMERQRSAVRDESGQEELLQKMEQFNLLRESNAALRADNTRAQRQLQAVQGRLKNAEAQLAPLQQRIRELEAAQDSAGAELSAAREESERWRKRAQQLMQKYESVDAAEYQRVSVELTAAQDAARAAEATTAERQCQLDAAREALAAAEQRIEAMERDSKAAAGKLSAELESSKSEAENHRKRSVAIWSAVVATCNRDRKPLQEWKALQLQKERRLAELEEQVKALQGEAAEGENSAAELAALRARVSQLEMELGAAQQEAKTAKQSAIDYGKRTAASKKAVESQLHDAKQQLAAAQEAEQSARVRVAAFESERENLTAAANALKEELRQCQEQLRAAKAHGGAGGRHGTRTAAAREAAKTQIAAIQQQAIEDVNSKLKRKQPPTEEQEQHEDGMQAVEGRGEQGQPAAELAPVPAAGQRKKPKLRLSAPTFTPSKGTVPSAPATVEEIGPVDEQVPQVPIAPEPAAEVLDAEQPEEEKEGYVDHEMQPEEGGAEEEEHAEQPQSTEEAEIADEQGEETIGEEEATAAVEEEEEAEVEEEEQEEREGAYEAGQGEEHVAQVDVHDGVDMLEDEQQQQRQQEAEDEGIDEGEEEREEEDIEEIEAEERGAEPLSPQHEDEVQGAGDGDGGDIAEEEVEVEAEGGEGEEIEEGLEQQQEQEEEGQPAEETKGEPQRGASVSPVQQSAQQGASPPVTGLKQPRDGGPAGRQNKSKRRAPIAWVPPPPSAPKTKIPAPPKPAVSAPATIPGALQLPGMGMLPFGGGVEPYSPSGLPQGGHPPPVPGGMVMPGRGVRAPGRLGVRGRARGRGRMAGSNPPPPPPPPSSQS